MTRQAPPTAAAGASPALSVRGLEVGLPVDGRYRTVVDAFDLDLLPGEIVGLVGESGCGKTLAGSALLGLRPGPGGQIRSQRLRLGGRDLSGLDERGWRPVRGRDIAMVFQEPLTALDPVLRIGRQIGDVVRRHRGGGSAEAARQAERLLEEAGLPDAQALLRRYPHELSGGMRQRVLLAMALSCSPTVLVADEPTTALDVTTRAAILDLLERRARDHGTAVLLITHDLSVVEQVCQRALVMYAGRIVEDGPAIRLTRTPAHPYTAALGAAMPRLCEGDPVPVRAIPGQVPPAGRPPPGCRFHDRCPHADAECRTLAPERTASADDPAHGVACHHPLGGEA